MEDKQYMKILIWGTALLIAAIINTIFSYCGVRLGAIPIIIIYGILFFIAKKLCEIRDYHKRLKDKTEYYNCEFAKRFGNIKHPYTGKNVSTVQEYLDAYDSMQKGENIVTTEKLDYIDLNQIFKDRFGSIPNMNVQNRDDYLKIIDEQKNR